MIKNGVAKFKSTTYVFICSLHFFLKVLTSYEKGGRTLRNECSTNFEIKIISF